MTLDIWAQCSDKIFPVSLSGEIFRVVESQEKIATNELVDTLEEQALLEEMLELTKPTLPDVAHGLAYLLFTPFRYPPLKYGSRFGSRFEPSLFYGSRKLTTALAEMAYYRLHFWFDMSIAPPAGKLKTQLTAFSAEIKTAKGLELQAPPFLEYETHLMDKAGYNKTQALGTSMRENGFDAFEYVSARDVDKGLNVGLFTPDVLARKKPTSTENLLCSTDALGVKFMDESSVVYFYPLTQFLVNDHFPLLA